VSARPKDTLTPREKEIIGQVLEGKGVRQIAEGIGIGKNTVRNHLQSIYRKTGAGSLRELQCMFCRESGIEK